MKLSSKFRTTNGGGDGYIQTFGSLASSWMRRDEEFLIDECLCFGTNTVSFISHNKQTIGRERFTVDVFAFKEGAVNWDALGNGREKTGEVCVMECDTRNGAHCGLNDLGGKGVGGVFRANDVVNAKPVGKSDDRAEVARVLHSVKHDAEFLTHHFTG